MDINDNIESPLNIKISFNKLLKHYDALLLSDDVFMANKAKGILDIVKKYPELRDGFSDISAIKAREKEIAFILQDIFSPLLTNNEIKTASAPFHDLIFNASERFKNIVKTAGKDFKLQMKNMPENDIYIVACTIILGFCYDFHINFKRPFYYEIPDANGILRYYKILYNADFCEIIPNENAPKITQADYDELLDNYENIDLWKEKFPPNSYTFKGFAISNIFDVTDDQSISNIKSNLISDDKSMKSELIAGFHDIFSSLFGIKNLKVGFSIYNEEEDIFERIYGDGMSSYLLGEDQTKKCADALCCLSYNRLLKENKVFSVSNVDDVSKCTTGEVPPHITSLKKQGIKSAIFAPIANDDGLMGIIEIVSNTPQELNSINANKLVDVMPYIISAVERSKNEEENLIEAIIQKECTSIHSSVHWRFVKEAKNFIKSEMSGEQASFKKIAFENVYPLYGQIDIKGSSEARNLATKEDLTLQLNIAKSIFEKAFQIENLPIYEQFIYQIDEYLEGLNQFQVDSEQQISSFFKNEMETAFEHMKVLKDLQPEIESYFNAIDKKVHVLYNHRKQYDKTVALINKSMAALLDKKQEDAQKMYPHYFERFKTDGVEHNMYVGESITKEDSFNPIYLYNLRLWQLQVMCEMENEFYKMQHKFPVALDVASMVLVFNQPLTISFRMDEKQFDVDGTYNARYEIVKKRVDKAHIKGSSERVTQKGKISIVYSQKQDEIEYLQYIKFLQAKHYVDTDVEIVELEDLQAVTGLKAIRVSVLYHKNEEDKAFYTYDDLMTEIKA
ncbi:GAF domain-containing protein [Algibacter pacificus]|uniref:GAF domain-containing protein n=1 Tax=Algibacter pacificus TaxID=2599389 RepID=UPI0011CAC38F|nr:GAF domain-containing protein [Algibacter pacificus]